MNKDDWPTTPVGEAAHKLDLEDTMSPEDNAIDALAKMMSGQADNLGRFPVVASGELVGIISRRDILQMLEFKGGLGK